MTKARTYRWTVSPRTGEITSEDGEKIRALADELTISPILAEILVRRNVDTFEKARAFFRPSLSHLHDPFRMLGMDRAVERVLRAVRNKERILVYGDYDVDGTNGTTLLWTFIRSIGGDVSYFIPDRQKEGYGLSDAGLESVRELRPSLIVAVDCGITSVDQVAKAAADGIDVVICDHHEPGPEGPKAVAVLDPLQPDCPYPFKSLCGAGVAFKLIQALCTVDEVREKLERTGEDPLQPYLQYVALATTADIVPLTGENRVLALLGLEGINTQPLPGLQALIDTAGLTPGRINSGQTVFVLAPRINAVGRLGDATRAVALLAADSYAEALSLAKVLEDENVARRKIDTETFEEADALVKDRITSETNAIVLHKDDWHPGVIGIVASRLVEHYYRPTVMLTTVDGLAKGSARSVSGFNIHDALKQCEDHLVQFGGHKYAAGLTVERENIPAFREAFERIAGDALTEELLTPELRIDAEISLSDISPKFIRVLQQFAPFGPENMRPVFAVRDVGIIGTPRIVGKNHLKFKVKKGTFVIDAIGFNLGHLLDRIRPGLTGVDLAFSLDENEYRGEVVPQLKIRDILVRSQVDADVH